MRDGREGTWRVFVEAVVGIEAKATCAAAALGMAAGGREMAAGGEW